MPRGSGMTQTRRHRRSVKAEAAGPTIADYYRYKLTSINTTHASVVDYLEFLSRSKSAPN